MDKKEKPLKIGSAISFLIMIAVSIISFILPLDGRNIKEIALSYPNYVFPSNYAFFIWIPILVLLGLFALYQLDLFHNINNRINNEVLFQSRILFLALCWSSIPWIAAWLYDYMALSAVLILIILIYIRFICKFLSKMDLSRQGRLFIRLPFSMVYGWLTISAVLNFVILFVSIGWKGFGIPIPAWETAALAGTAVYAAIRTHLNKDVIYCITIIWGYIGILVRHISKTEFSGHYPLIIISVIICIVLLAASAGYTAFRKKSII